MLQAIRRSTAAVHQQQDPRRAALRKADRNAVIDRLALLHPRERLRALTLGAMPVAATVIGDRRVRTVLTAHDMPAESRRAAARDRRHHLQLAEAHMASIGFTPSGPVVAEDVRNLQSWTGHQRRASSGRLVLLDLADEMIERAGDVADRIGRDLRIGAVVSHAVRGDAGPGSSSHPGERLTADYCSGLGHHLIVHEPFQSWPLCAHVAHCGVFGTHQGADRQACQRYGP